ncbi:protein transport protein SEC31 isoform 2 [Corchorus olitorius]|uniref:Protein transport protein SEC31 isoform 2 n=1 Tax=Corchorus olitorius TaxID=93759 RepID=A0A1R3IHN7_9ROSI|nr:protein transport protein SEC31 isoform 2 [Corchorus olitorius]
MRLADARMPALMNLISSSVLFGVRTLKNDDRELPLDERPSSASEASEQALVGRLSGSVYGIEFNAIAPNLLAAGTDGGKICIWDLAEPAQPCHFPPLKGSGSAVQGEILFLLGIAMFNISWHQLPTMERLWHPDVATQLVVASDEDAISGYFVHHSPGFRHCVPLTATTASDLAIWLKRMRLDGWCLAWHFTAHMIKKGF